ncbi:glycosyltransferase family 39 protein [Spirillospora sp. NPDC047279]|uniref:glycosyltransferase family 39 protein n=1 Tax=Spirillospora sp. NPDC047279 TaxID=3155478 RepID=UPI0033C77883
MLDRVAGGDDAAIAEEAVAGADRGGGRRRSGRAAERSWPSFAGRFGLPAIPAAAALAVSFWGISRPSFWMDEAATISMASRDLPDLERAVTENLDLVHACYYLVMRQWMAFFGHDELALRSLSALATAVAAAGVTALGRRCASAWVGLVAGLVYAGNVTVTRYAQEARPFALATTAAVVAAYLLVRALQSPRWWWAWLAGHTVAMILVGLLNLFTLLLVPALLVTVAWGLFNGVARKRVALGWIVSMAVTGGALYRFAVMARGQKQQVKSIPSPTWDDVWQLVEFLAGHRTLIWMTLVATVLGLVAGVRRKAWIRREHDGVRPAPTLTMLAAPWLLLSPAVLLLVSLSTPLYRHRYMVFCLPALALLIAAALVWTARVWRPLPLAGLAVLAWLAVPQQIVIRGEDERWDDLRTPANVLRAQARPGDAVLFLTPAMRWRASGYPDAYRGLDDVMMQRSPVEAGNLLGVDAGLETLKLRMCAERRVWVLWDFGGRRGVPPWVEARLRFVGYGGDFVTVREWNYKRGRLSLMILSPAAEPRRGCP